MVIKGKRGIFFMMITLVIISLFLLSITFVSTVAYRKSVQKRVGTLSEFVSSTESDLSRQLFIFSYRSVFLMENQIAQSDYLGYNNFENLFQESFFQGTINGQTQEMLTGSTYGDIVSLLGERASKISAEISTTNPTINVTQEDPWNLKVTLIMNFFVKDKNNLASWNKTLESVVFISISNFTDPIYLREAGISKDIKKNPNEIFGTAASLQDQLNNGLYSNYTNAPSFIDRLEGNIGGTHPNPRYPEFGIESFVDLENDLGGGLQPEKSVVDYLFFNGATSSYCRINGMSTPTWFRLDTPAHTIRYGVSCA
jgi:hypothetical protein